MTPKKGLSGTFIPKRVIATYTATSATAPASMPASTADVPPLAPVEVNSAW